MRNNKWEQQFKSLDAYDGMPAIGTMLHNWKNAQLQKGVGGLDKKIQKVIAENEEGTVWSDWKARLIDCIAQKKHHRRRRRRRRRRS